MDRFVFGTDIQFDKLDQDLNDGQCKIYKNISLPSGFNVSVCRIGFEKHRETSSYKILIDKGIKCTANVPLYFKSFLSVGEINFMDYYDVKSFFRNLHTLYNR